MDKQINPAWAQEIRREAAALKADEEHLHNNQMHDRILSIWKEHSPVMWRRLTAAQLAQPLAMVLQARMWKRQEDLMRGGLPVTDAREVAEREILMLEPEAEAGDRIPDSEQLPL